MENYSKTLYKYNSVISANTLFEMLCRKETSTLVTEKDFYKVTWSEFDQYANFLSEQVRLFCQNNGIKIDFICPIMRGGAVLAVYMSHLLSIIPCIPIQFKHLNEGTGYLPPKLIWEPFSFFSESKISKSSPIILLVEGNQYTGRTAQESIKLLNEKFSTPKIIYVSIARDYFHQNSVQGTIFNTNIFFTNENAKEIPIEDQLKLSPKNPVFPWETVIEEMNEINNVDMPITSSLFH